MLWITPDHLRQIGSHAEKDAPQEACGLIGGTEHNGLFRAIAVVSIPNRAADPLHQFYMDEAALVQTLMGFEDSGLSLVGIYHSHPTSDPIPSPADIRTAYYPGTPYLIISRTGERAACAAWDIRAGDVTPILLHISDTPPRPTEIPVSPPRSLPVIMIISALLAVTLMLVLALSLLPPAPPLPR